MYISIHTQYVIKPADYYNIITNYTCNSLTYRYNVYDSQLQYIGHQYHYQHECITLLTY